MIYQGMWRIIILKLMINDVRNKSQGRGFTIIETTIVLSIMATILLAVLVLVPSLKRGERNDHRRVAAQYAASQLNIYFTDHARYPFVQGNRAGQWGPFYNSVIKGHDIDPLTGESIFGDGDIGDAPDPANDDAESCSTGGPALTAGQPCTYKEFSQGWAAVGKAQIYFDARCGAGGTPVSNGRNSSYSIKNSPTYAIVVGLEPAGNFACIGS